MLVKKVRLDQIVINLDNFRKPLNNVERNSMVEGKLYPYCGANGIIDYINEFIFDEEILCIAEDGGSWGYNQKCCYLMDEKCWVNNHAHVIKATEAVDIKYLYYYLNHKDLNNKITGTTRGKLTKTALNSIEVSLPSLDIQKKIANILDQAQELIDKRKAQIEALDELIKSVFYDMFGDPKYNKNHYNIVKIEDVCWKVTDGDHNTPIRENSGYLLLSARNVKNGYIDLSGGVDYVGQIEFDRMSKRCNPEEGDVLISCSGTIGRVTKVKIKDPFVLVRSVALLKPNDTINATFLENYLRTQYLQLLMYRNSSKSSQANLFNNKIKALPVMVPPIDIQNQFAEIVENIEKQKELLNRSLIELENNFNSLMQRAFKGELF